MQITWEKLDQIADSIRADSNTVFDDEATMTSAHVLHFFAHESGVEEMSVLTTDLEIFSMDELDMLIEDSRELLEPNVSAVGIWTPIPREVHQQLFGESSKTLLPTLFHIEHITLGAKTWARDLDWKLMVSGLYVSLPTCFTEISYKTLHEPQ